MFYSSDHRGVCIFVRGEFVAPREWLIHATVESGSGIDGALATEFPARTVGELWRAIQLERRVGRQLGAAVVRVVVDGDLDIARLFAATANPDGSLAESPAHPEPDTRRNAPVAPPPGDLPHQDATSA